MLVEFSIIPLGIHSNVSGEIAEALKLVDASGLPYQLTPTGTCVEGEWDEVIPLVRRCHARVREMSPHVVTTIKIEDEDGALDKITRNVASVEEKVGHSLTHTHPLREKLAKDEVKDLLKELK